MGVVQLDPHNNMTPEQCLGYASRNHDEYQDVLVVGYDRDGDVIIRSSHISRADAAWIMLEALDQIRCKGS